MSPGPTLKIDWTVNIVYTLHGRNDKSDVLRFSQAELAVGFDGNKFVFRMLGIEFRKSL